MSLPSLCEQIYAAHLYSVRASKERQADIDREHRIKERRLRVRRQPREKFDTAIRNLFAAEPDTRFTCSYIVERFCANGLECHVDRIGKILDVMAQDLKVTRYPGSSPKKPTLWGYRGNVISVGLGDHQNVTKLRTGRKGAAS